MCELITWGSGTQQVNTTLLDPMYTDSLAKDWTELHIK
jgi:hypothetical protein